VQTHPEDGRAHGGQHADLRDKAARHGHGVLALAEHAPDAEAGDVGHALQPLRFVVVFVGFTCSTQRADSVSDQIRSTHLERQICVFPRLHRLHLPALHLDGPHLFVVGIQ
jgi:hypothetical protein